MIYSDINLCWCYYCRQFKRTKSIQCTQVNCMLFPDYTLNKRKKYDTCSMRKLAQIRISPRLLSTRPNLPQGSYIPKALSAGFSFSNMLLRYQLYRPGGGGAQPVQEIFVGNAVQVIVHVLLLMAVAREVLKHAVDKERGHRARSCSGVTLCGRWWMDLKLAPQRSVLCTE